MPKGMFVTFEGIDGSGKTTHAKTFCEFLTEMGVDFVCSREPGGTPLGEDIRNFALKKYDDKSKKAELYLFEASRAEHYEKVRCYKESAKWHRKYAELRIKWRNERLGWSTSG